MAKRISPAAFHTARMLFKKYDFVVRPPETRHPRYDNLQATPGHVAIFIDYKTNIGTVGNLRPELSWWQDLMKTGVNDNHTAQQLTVFLRKIIDTLERIPHFPEEETPEVVTTSVLTTAGAYTVRMNLSKASLDAMETLFYYYTIALRNPGRFSDERIVRRGVAGMTESCLQVAKAMRALPFLRRCVDFLLRGQATAEDLAVVLQRVGTLFEFLPSFGFEPGTYDRDEDKLLI